MKKYIPYFNWLSKLKEIENSYFIKDDLILIDKFIMPIESHHPFRLDMVIALFCLKGEIKAKIDLKTYTTSASGMMIILADQIIELESVSNDFEGFAIVMSKHFLSNLNLEEGFSAYVSVRDNPSTQLLCEEMDEMLKYYSLIKDTLKSKGNPNLLKITQLLTKAFFYGIGYQIHNKTHEKQLNNKNSFTDNFSKLVNKHFKEHRNIGFYADKLCLSPKYMSTIIKEYTGKSAGEWIDDRVILEIKTLLKSSDMTIQEIGNELNFSSSSCVGKYFKRHMGISPKQYRNT